MAPVLESLLGRDRHCTRKIRLRAPSHTTLNNPVVRRDADNLLRDDLRRAGVHEEPRTVQAELAVHGTQFLPDYNQWSATGALPGAIDPNCGKERSFLCDL